MAWRAMRSLEVLRAQVNTEAPGRSKASDGLVGDQDHQQNNPGSGHNPHYVAGVGDEIVTAWDCTHDPSHGCDCGVLTEALRTHRDKRIRYVIFDRHIFSSYATGGYPAWAWRPYTGVDPHTGHAHIQTLDDPIADTDTPWNLEGFTDMSYDDNAAIRDYATAERAYKILVEGLEDYQIAPFTAPAGKVWTPAPEHSVLIEMLKRIDAGVQQANETLAEILTLLQADGGSGGGVLPPSGQLEAIKRDVDLLVAAATAAGQVVTSPPPVTP